MGKGSYGRNQKSEKTERYAFLVNAVPIGLADTGKIKAFGGLLSCYCETNAITLIKDGSVHALPTGLELTKAAGDDISTSIFDADDVCHGITQAIKAKKVRCLVVSMAAEPLNKFIQDNPKKLDNRSSVFNGQLQLAIVELSKANEVLRISFV